MKPLTLAGALCLVLEQAWERRTRREMAEAGSRPAPLMRRWLEAVPVAVGDAARLYADHFEAEIGMSRDFAVVGALLLAAADAVARPGPARNTLACALVALPFSKLVAKPLFNEVEAAAPLVGRLALLREEEVVWGLAASLARDGADWPESKRRLARVPVPSRAQRAVESLDLDPPRSVLFEQRALDCRQRRRRLQRRLLGGLAAGVGLIVGGVAAARAVCCRK